LSRLPCRHECFRFIPLGFAGVFAVELSTQRTGDMNQAGTSFPATPSFFELAGPGVFRVAAFAFRAVLIHDTAEQLVRYLLLTNEARLDSSVAGYVGSLGTALPVTLDINAALPGTPAPFNPGGRIALCIQPSAPSMN
jgi:hypothetical protein